MAEKPSVTLPGTVERIIQSSEPGQPEKAQIEIEGADSMYCEIRIENSLTGENGEPVRLKNGAEVDVTLEVEPEAINPKNK
jgi:hypothetical protein